MIISSFMQNTTQAVVSAAPSPDVSNDKWTFLVAVLTSVIAPIILAIIYNRTLKPPPQSPEDRADSNRVSTERGNSFSAEGMPASMVEVLLSMWKKMEEMEETQANWASERAEFIRINEELRRHNRALAEGFDEVIDWIDRGAQPPPPSVAQHVRDLVQRAIENGTYNRISTDAE